MQAPVTGAPYSAVEVRTTQQTLAGGNQIQRQEQTKVFRDSQGRVRTETSFRRPDGQEAARISITDPVGRTIREVDPQNKVVHEMAMRGPGRGNRPMPQRPNGGGAITRPNGGAQRMRGPANNPNVRTENLGVQYLNGVAATGTRVTRTIPAGAEGNTLPMQIVHETWYSEDLRVPVLIKTSDPRYGSSVTELTNIARTEPDPALFQAPADYTVQRGPQGRGGRGPGRFGPGGGQPK